MAFIDRSKMYEISSGKLTILVDPDFREKAIKTALDLADYFEMTLEERKNCLDKTAKLCDIEEAIASQKNIDIFSYLPLTKAGNIPQNRKILVADTGIVYKVNEYGGLRGIQLRLVPFYGTIEELRQGIIRENALQFEFGAVGNPKSTDPIFDKNGIPSKIDKPRNSYLKDEAITPGSVYVDAKGTEYLYLGRLTVNMIGIKNGVPEDYYLKRYGDNITRIEDIPAIFGSQGNFGYIRMTKKLYTMAEKHTSLDSFMKAFIDENTKGCSTSWYSKASIRENPRKFTANSKKLFDDNKIVSDWHNAPLEVEEDGNTFNYVFRITQS